MQIKEIEKILNQALEDDILNRDEKLALSVAVEDLQVDELNFLRNKAFDIAREHIDKGTDVLSVIKWLEKIVKVMNGKVEREVISNAYFSPGDDCKKRLIQLCKRAQKTLDVCVFTISDNHLSEELLRAYQRGVDVRVITDDDKAEDRGSDVYQLIKAGVSVRTDSDDSHMHHKFVIRDFDTLCSGSFNWTRSATERNQENLIVTNELKLVNAFAKRFDELWQLYKPVNYR